MREKIMFHELPIGARFVLQGDYFEFTWEKTSRRKARRLAKGSPVFDPTHPITMGSTLVVLSRPPRTFEQPKRD